LPVSTIKVKPWGKADKKKLTDFINEWQINITNTSLSNIEQVRNLHFCLHEARNFRRNFHVFLAAWDLEVEYSGARRIEGGAMMGHLLLLILLPMPVL
jgi:hypothetical protein